MPVIYPNATEQDIVALGLDPDAMVEVANVTTLVSHNAAITEIVAKIENDIVIVTAEARRSPEDRFDPKIGHLLAVSRAYEKLGRRIAARANGRVEHNAKMATIRREQRLRTEDWKEKVVTLASRNPEVKKAVRKGMSNRPTVIPRVTVTNAPVGHPTTVE